MTADGDAGVLSPTAPTITTDINTGRGFRPGTRLKATGIVFKGKVKEQWGKLTDDDLTQIQGQRRTVGRAHPEAPIRHQPGPMIKEVSRLGKQRPVRKVQPDFRRGDVIRWSGKNLKRKRTPRKPRLWKCLAKTMSRAIPS